MTEDIDEIPFEIYVKSHQGKKQTPLTSFILHGISKLRVKKR